MHPWKSSLTLSGSCGPCSLHPTSYFLLPTSDFLLLLPTPYIPHPNLIILRPLHPTSYFLLPTSYSLLPISCILLPTPYSLHPTPCFLLPTSYSLLPTPYIPLPHLVRLLRLRLRGRGVHPAPCTLGPRPRIGLPPRRLRHVPCTRVPRAAALCCGRRGRRSAQRDPHQRQRAPLPYLDVHLDRRCTRLNRAPSSTDPPVGGRR